MKKLLLTTSLISLMSNYCLAHEDYIEPESAGIFDVASSYSAINFGFHKLNKPEVKGATLKSNNNAYSLSAAYGYYAYNDLRVELNLSHNLNEELHIKSNELKIKPTTTSLMLNGYANLYENNGFDYYAMAGIGGARVAGKLKNAAGGYADVRKVKPSYNMAFNLGFGTVYHWQDNLHVNLGYKFTRYGQMKTTNKPVLYGHDVALGFIFNNR